MPMWRHLIAALMLAAIALNLFFWMILLFAVIPAQTLVPQASFRHHCTRVVERIYRLAVRFHSLLIRRCLGIDIMIRGDLPTDPSQPLIIVSNHRSWFDIFVLHDVLTARGGPILKFLIKKELAWVPIVGWLCFVLGFPRLSRGRSDAGREKDYQSITAAAESLTTAAGALMNFAEGTRFTPAKHADQGSEYTHLLKPRTGGLGIMLGALTVDIIDVTLVYPVDGMSFWRCLGGDLRHIEVYLERHCAADVGDVREWLEQRWREKDDRIANSPIRERV